MERFDAFVVRADCVVSADAVRIHPNVKNVIELPREWLFYEFHHPLFGHSEFLTDKWQQKMDQCLELKQARIAMLREERALRRPWYERKETRFGDSAGRVGTELVQYFVCTLDGMLRVNLHLEAGWGCSREFGIKFEHPQAPTSLRTVQKLVEELLICGTPFALNRDGEEFSSDALTVSMKSDVLSSHWVVALWALLSDSRLNVGIREMIYLKEREADSLLGQ